MRFEGMHRQRGLSQPHCLCGESFLRFARGSLSTACVESVLHKRRLRDRKKRSGKAQKGPKTVVSGFDMNQGLATPKCETLVYTPRFSLQRLIKWHTDFVTTQCCARRSIEPPGFSFPSDRWR